MIDKSPTGAAVIAAEESIGVITVESSTVDSLFPQAKPF